MKIAITGATGFVGRYVTEQLNQHGVEVIALSRGRTSDACIDVPGIRFEGTDYSVDSLIRILQGVGTVIHLAAVRGGDGAMVDYHDNERITENLLRAMAEAGTEQIIYASSRMVYSGEENIPWKETDIPAPNSLYGISKMEGENLCSYYSRKFGFRSTAIRIAQVMGPGEKVRNMMSVFLEKAANGEQLKVIGASKAKRQYIYVKDLAEVISRIALDSSAQGCAGTSGRAAQDVINAGMEQAYTNLEIAQAFSDVFGLPAPEYDDSKPETITPSIMDVGRMVERTGFHPRDMRDALEDIRQELTDVSR